MEESQRWNAMYTNHVRQKRKIYHDGFLVLQSSRNKVMLYDECDTLLETRFVKKDDLIKSGETVIFASYLVDLGELCKGHQPSSILNSQEKDRKVSDTSSSLYSYNSQNRKPMVGKSKGRLVNLSPSQKMIRDFKKNEVSKFGSSPICMDMTKEWQVLYTTQITQKAKKFHDGFLQLIVRGSQGRQVKLYDTNRRHLDGRFLKKDEIVSSGESLVLEGHLVDIGEQEEDHKLPTDLNVSGKGCNVVGKNDMAEYQAKIPTNKKFAAGKTPGNISQGTFTKISDSSYKTENTKLSWRDAEPKRSVHDILSILRQPSEKKVVVVKVEDCAESHSSELQSYTDNHIKEYTEECSGTATEQLRGKRSEHDSMIKVIKSEAVEVVIDAEECTVSENGRESQARSSSFHRRSQTMGFISPIHGVQHTDHKLMLNSSSMESQAAVTAALNCEGQKEIESESLTRSYKKTVTETNAALANGLSSSKLPEEDTNGSSSRCHSDFTSHNLSGPKETTLKQDTYAMDMYEIPSFDLGF
ncbi:hypothetical protein C2S52_003017 [Perilla frutescens var. hirtella]|nr:hypothetical protein C2S52_003017 [Perilla frutescens var. hirtella]